MGKSIEVRLPKAGRWGMARNEGGGESIKGRQLLSEGDKMS